MSVIGRLDEQVDRVLISPLAPGAAKDADVRGANEGEEEAHPRASVQPAGERIHPARRADGGRLPVWLL